MFLRHLFIPIRYLKSLQEIRYVLFLCYRRSNSRTNMVYCSFPPLQLKYSIKRIFSCLLDYQNVQKYIFGRSMFGVLSVVLCRFKKPWLRRDAPLFCLCSSNLPTTASSCFSFIPLWLKYSRLSKSKRNTTHCRCSVSPLLPLPLQKVTSEEACSALLSLRLIYLRKKDL